MSVVKNVKLANCNECTSRAEKVEVEACKRKKELQTKAS
jgi:hypothetical protein